MAKLQSKIGECEASVAKMRAQAKAATKQLEKLKKDAVKQGEGPARALTGFDCGCSMFDCGFCAFDCGCPAAFAQGAGRCSPNLSSPFRTIRMAPRQKPLLVLHQPL